MEAQHRGNNVKANCKRCRSAENEEPIEHVRKSPRLQGNLNNPRHSAHDRVNPPSRTSPRLRQIRDSNKRRAEQSRYPKTSLRRTAKTHHCIGQKQPQADSKQHRRVKNKNQSLETKTQRSVKHRRSIEDGEVSNRDAKRPKYSDTREQWESRIEPGKSELIEDWLNTSCRPRGISTDKKPLLQGVSDNMPRKPADVLPSPSDSFSSAISRASEKSTASVHDADYRTSLRYRNIYINREYPPKELMRDARRIITRSRASPEIDDATAQKLIDKSRGLEDKAEEDIVQQLAPHLILAMDEVPDQRLARSAGQLWCDSVPVPLNPNVLTNPLPLPRPKPDLAFGYSEAAFTEKQLGIMGLLVDDQSGRSYAVPDKKLLFPFLDIEFKSQAKGGTHYIGTNQAAGAGAIALNGNLELVRRSFGWGELDFKGPQFFSLTMDHELARINVHWLGAPTKDGSCSFHVEGLSKHLLDDPNDLRAIQRAVKNILDYGGDARLRSLCKALDTYREKIIKEREAAASGSKQPDNVQTKVQSQRRRRRRTNRKEHLPSDKQQNGQSQPDLQVEESATHPQQRRGRRDRLMNPPPSANPPGPRRRRRSSRIQGT